MVMKASTTARAAPSTPADAPLPTEAQNRASDLQSQDPEASRRDAEEAARATAREAQVRQAAYEAYLRRAGAPGSELDDWLEAERSIDQRTGGPGDAGGPST